MLDLRSKPVSRTRAMKLLHVFTVAALTATAAQAQQPAPQSIAANDLVVPQAVATRTKAAVRVDGLLAEPQWQTATRLGDLRQLDPQEGRPATERSDIRFLYDDEALYIGASEMIRSYRPTQLLVGSL